jgi:RES domain-containing protein
MSGDGAKSKGGRFNPVGVPALYLARTIEGCFLEQAHGFPLRFDPLTVCTYDLDIEGMVDLTTDPGRGAANVQLSELQCSWADDMAAGKEPASWKVAKRLIAEGASGIIVPSFARGARPDMHNVVLWKWGPDLPRRVWVHDPSGRLPKNQLSWTRHS